MQRSTGRSVAGDEEQNRDTIPTPRFARGSSVKNSFIAAEGECSHNIMADQQRNQNSELHLISSLDFQRFRWETRFKTEVGSCSKFPAEAMLWIIEVRWSIQWTISESSCSIHGNTHFLNFELLDARIASALNEIIQHSHFKKEVSLEEQRPRKRTVSFAGDRSLS